ncbi:MAG TPA: tetratricopeptide repeat protein, partial [Thermoanaerobaculia bacterium]|nr:tetratricopeptide repeat protein [Thermoanaerobaculia bacterium]
MREAEAALHVDPRSSDAHRLRGAVLKEWKRPSEAQAEYERAIEINPRDSWALYNIGVLRDDAGDWDGAVAAYDRAIAIEPSPAAYNNRGWIRLQQKRYADARADFERTLLLDPDHGNGNLNLARVEIAEARFTSAIDRLSRVIALDPENDEAFEVRAAAYDKVGETAKAADDRA